MAHPTENVTKDKPLTEVEVDDIEGFSILESTAPPSFMDKITLPSASNHHTQISLNSSHSNSSQMLKRKRMSSITQPSVVGDALKSLNGRGSIEEIVSWMSFNFPECFGDFSAREMVKVYSQIGKIICKNKLWFSLELSDEARSSKTLSSNVPAQTKEESIQAASIPVVRT